MISTHALACPNVLCLLLLLLLLFQKASVPEMSSSLALLNMGRFCVDPFKIYKKKIHKCLRDIPAQLLKKWNLSAGQAKISYFKFATNRSTWTIFFHLRYRIGSSHFMTIRIKFLQILAKRNWPKLTECNDIKPFSVPYSSTVTYQVVGSYVCIIPLPNLCYSARLLFFRIFLCFWNWRL